MKEDEAPGSEPATSEAEVEQEDVPPAADPPAEPDAPPPSEPDEEDDEALLASLDEETAGAIRVMRRLSADKKSVRELLHQYQASLGDQNAAPPRKKGRFLRGR